VEGKRKRMKGVRQIGILCGIVFLLLFCLSGEAQEKRETKKGEANRGKAGMGFGFNSSNKPINIDSDTVEANQKQNTITFAGNVVAKQEDVTLYANTLVVHYQSENENRKIKEIIASGNVKIVQLDRRATSRKATFYQDENKVVLDGDAVVRDGENVIRGDRVIYYVNEERSIVEGGKGNRVNTTITPAQKE
jgi:lipopolysaccharide export system protein LptA